MSDITPTPGQPHGQIDFAQVHSKEDVGTEAALQIVISTVEKTESWLASRFWAMRWLEADTLAQSPPGNAVWEGTNVPMANISKFTVATHINALKAKSIEGLFYEEDPFVLRPRDGADSDTVRAITSVQGAQLDEANFRMEVDLGFYSTYLFGTGIWKWGWRNVVKEVPKYVRRAKPTSVTMPGTGHTITVPTAESDKFDIQYFEEVHAYPWLENVDIRHVLVDSGCRRPDIRTAKSVTHRMDLTYRDLIDMKDDPFANYDLPSEDEIREWFAPPVHKLGGETGNTAEAYSQTMNTAYVIHAAPRFASTGGDPLDEPLEVLEYVDNEKVITVLNRVRVIRNERNPFRKINYYSLNWWSNADAFWGTGLGRVLGADQRTQQGLTNAILDVTNLSLNPTYLRAKGANILTQQIRQRIGGIIDIEIRPEAGVRSVKDAFGLLEQPEIPQAAFAEIQASEARAEEISGANEQLMMGGTPSRGKTSMGRTATGAGGLMSAIASRVGAVVEDFNRQVFQPWLWQMHELNCERLPTSVLRRMLNDELGAKFKMDEENYYNCPIEEFQVLAGSHLVAKQQMAQSMGFIIQLFDNPQTIQQLAEINGEYVDVGALLHNIYDTSGWRGYRDVVKKLTPEMEKRRQQNNPALQKAQAAAQQEDHKTANKSALIDQEGMIKAVHEVLRQVIAKGISPELLTGEPGGTGFGSETSS